MTWDGEAPIGSLPAIAARRFGRREALGFCDRRYTFEDVERQVDSVARGLIALGVAPSDRVAIWLTNTPEWIFFSFALARIGAVQVPVNTRFRTADLQYILDQAECSVLVTQSVSGPIDYLRMVKELVPLGNDLSRSRDIARTIRHVVVAGDEPFAGCVSTRELRELGGLVGERQLQQIAAGVDAAQMFSIMYTSGTSGFPKGVMRSHRAQLSHHEPRMAALQVSDRDVYLNYLPLFHVFGYMDGPISSMLRGSRQVLMDRFDPDEAIRLIEAERVTMLGGFETHLNDLADAQLRRRADLSSLRAGLFATGTESATRALVRAREILAPLKTVSVYGTTEIGANITLSRLDSTDEQALTTSGKPSAGCEVRIVDPESMEPVETGVHGEIQVRSGSVMLGYFRKPEETARVFTPDGWFRTGDLGCLRPDGYLHFRGRLKDMLKIGGENVDPIEIESYLLQHPGVREAAVVGCADERLTEVAVAYVVPRDGSGLTEESVISFVKGRIASFKVPRRVRLVEALPMTASGKIQKEILRSCAREEGLR